jgi:hypothetical protein
MYKLLFNDNQQVVGYTFIKEQQDGDIVFLTQDLPLVDEYLQPLNIEEHNETQDIQTWLKENDYKINKHLLGEYAENDPRWTDYLQQRQVKLARYNDLEQVIAQSVKEPFDLTLLQPVDKVVDDVVEQVVDDVVDDIIPIEEQINYSYEDIEAAKNMDVVEDLEKVEETDSTDEDTEKALTE